MSVSSENQNSMLGLFQTELNNQCQVIQNTLNDDALDSQAYKSVAKAAQGIKGAGRLVKIEAAVQLGESMENHFVALHQDGGSLRPAQLEALHQGLELLLELAQTAEQELEDWQATRQSAVNGVITALLGTGDTPAATPEPDAPSPNQAAAAPPPSAGPVADIPPIDPSMMDLFKIEVETHTGALMDNLLQLGNGAQQPVQLEALMRAAHSLKGAARMIGLESVVQVAHVMEDLFVAAQNQNLIINNDHVDVFLQVVDLIKEVGDLSATDYPAWAAANAGRVQQQVDTMSAIRSGRPAPKDGAPNGTAVAAPVDDLQIDESMLELFKIEIETHTGALSSNLLELESNPTDPQRLESLMRAAHSIKGAARMVGVCSAVELAHVMEDGFVAAQESKITLKPSCIDTQLAAVDVLVEIGKLNAAEHGPWLSANRPRLNQLVAALKAVVTGQTAPPPQEAAPPAGATPSATPPCAPAPASAPATTEANAQTQSQAANTQDRVVRISASRVNRLMGLSGELLVAHRWIRNYSSSMLALKKQQTELIALIDRLKSITDEQGRNDLSNALLMDAQSKADSCRQTLAVRLTELEDFDRRTGILSSRLNHEVISSRMRPFGDGVQGFQRMVRDVSRALGKSVVLEIVGSETQVDRDILEKVKAPLNHILRNAIDHGLETPEERAAAGKPETGTIRLEAFHSAGMLSIIVQDDGRGVDLDKLRDKILKKKMVNQAMAEELSESELLDFLFLPGFSTRDNVTEISGRGVGLDVVHSAMQEMRGQIRSTSKVGKGLKIHLQLPLTLSVMRSLLVEIGDETYAFPLSRIRSILRIRRGDVQVLEDRQYFTDENQHIGLLDAAQVLGKGQSEKDGDTISVVTIGDRNQYYGLAVDRFLGERDLAVHALDPRLGRVKDISAAAIMDDGTPTLIFDVDDILQSITNIISGRRVTKVKQKQSDQDNIRKQILVVDDSLTVREVERKLLEGKGYAVDVAVDGMDGWNTLRAGEYDLVISDVDMPRMNGIEFVTMIKNDPQLRSTPVMIVSYKDRQEDRDRGLKAGADYYLAKGSFHDDSLIDAVVDLIGEARQ